MGRRAQYEVGVAGVLEYYPPQGRVTSATVALFSRGSSAILAATAVTLDTASQTVTTAAAGDTSVTVASTTAFVVGRRYWLTSSSGGQGMEVRLVNKTATVLYLDVPIDWAVSSGTISGHRLSYTLTTTHTATEYRRARVEWRLTDLSSVVLPVVCEYVDICDRPWNPQLTAEDLRRISIVHGESVSARRNIATWAEAAWDQLWEDIEAHNAYPDLLRDTSSLSSLAVYWILFLRSIGNETAATHWRDLYREGLARLFETPQFLDEDEDLSPNDGADIRRPRPRYAGIG